MPKYFIAGDVHGFYDEYIKALFAAGYNVSDPNHWIILLGDNFDRGPQAKKMLEFLKGAPRLISIKGNHEDLLENMIARGYPNSYDISNKTLDTALQLTGEPADFTDLLLETRPVLRKMYNYYETENYIFVHGWIPVTHYSKNYLYKEKSIYFNEDWRNAPYEDWAKARWYNGFEMAHEGLIEKDKTIVCGHWHTSWPRAYYHNEPEFEEGANFDPYYDKGIIGIDACTAFSSKVNVIVLEDNEIERK